MKNSVLPDGKNAIIAYGGKTLSVRKAAGKYLSGMSEFFKGDAHALELIKYQMNKLDPGRSYAELISGKYAGDFVQEILAGS
ncbi:MAG: hypothetical protein VZR00_06155 [Lachnospiraceae bacterium]|nr:hypothetical protein [Lachnospiraceae bacterium]MEE3461459.1 hypothetical protein [Lachnospiraceae bacterium]